MSTPTKKLDPELEALVQLSENDIDTSDIPEVTDWSKAVVGRFYRPIKEPVTLRLDADIVAWLKSEGPGYQTRINALLRTAMMKPATNIGAPKRTDRAYSPRPDRKGRGEAQVRCRRGSQRDGGGG